MSETISFLVSDSEDAELFVQKQTVSTNDLENTVYKCVVCKQAFDTDELLTCHFENEHMKYSCEKCPQKFFKKSFLTQHKNRAHLESKNIKCPLCTTILRSRYNLRQHLYTHSKTRQFKCEYPGCERSFRQINSLSCHKKIHVNTNRKECPICKKMVTKLESHMWTHSEHKPFECDVCKKAFATKAILDVHLNSHSDERKFGCNECDASFKYSANLLKHKNAVHKRLEYMCDICHHVFSRKDNMMKHKKFVHRDIDEADNVLRDTGEGSNRIQDNISEDSVEFVESESYELVLIQN